MEPGLELEIIFTDERPDIWHIVRDLVSILHRAETKTREQQEVWNLIIYHAPGLLNREILFCCLFEEKSDLYEGVLLTHCQLLLWTLNLWVAGLLSFMCWGWTLTSTNWVSLFVRAANPPLGIRCIKCIKEDVYCSLLSLLTPVTGQPCHMSRPPGHI